MNRSIRSMIYFFVFSECKDNPTYENDCPGWKNFCFQDANEVWMKENCARTCGYCKGWYTLRSKLLNPINYLGGNGMVSIHLLRAGAGLRSLGNKTKSGYAAS